MRLSIDQVPLLRPIHVGELHGFLAAVKHTGSSSIEVGIKVVAENIRTQLKRHVDSCCFSMVAMDDERGPAAVPALQPAPVCETRRFHEAVLCKQQRHDLAARFRSFSGKVVNAP